VSVDRGISGHARGEAGVLDMPILDPDFQKSTKRECCIEGSSRVAKKLSILLSRANSWAFHKLDADL
jgi:hypothetical protein